MDIPGLIEDDTPLDLEFDDVTPARNLLQNNRDGDKSAGEDTDDEDLEVESLQKNIGSGSNSNQSLTEDERKQQLKNRQIYHHLKKWMHPYFQNVKTFSKGSKCGLKHFETVLEGCKDTPIYRPDFAVVLDWTPPTEVAESKTKDGMVQETDAGSTAASPPKPTLADLSLKNNLKKKPKQFTYLLLHQFVFASQSPFWDKAIEDMNKQVEQHGTIAEEPHIRKGCTIPVIKVPGIKSEEFEKYVRFYYTASLNFTVDEGLRLKKVVESKLLKLPVFDQAFQHTVENPNPPKKSRYTPKNPVKNVTKSQPKKPEPNKKHPFNQSSGSKNKRNITHEKREQKNSKDRWRRQAKKSPEVDDAALMRLFMKKLLK